MQRYSWEPSEWKRERRCGSTIGIRPSDEVIQFPRLQIKRNTYTDNVGRRKCVIHFYSHGFKFWNQNMPKLLWKKLQTLRSRDVFPGMPCSYHNCLNACIIPLRMKEKVSSYLPSQIRRKYKSCSFWSREYPMYFFSFW